MKYKYTPRPPKPQIDYDPREYEPSGDDQKILGFLDSAVSYLTEVIGQSVHAGRYPAAADAQVKQRTLRLVADVIRAGWHDPFHPNRDIVPVDRIQSIYGLLSREQFEEWAKQHAKQQRSRKLMRAASSEG